MKFKQKIKDFFSDLYYFLWVEDRHEVYLKVCDKCQCEAFYIHKSHNKNIPDECWWCESCQSKVE